MTLALYGKSRRRQGSLLLAALIAVVVAMAAGVAVIGTAFAHHSTHQIQASCTEGTWTYSADFFGGGDSGTPRRAKIYKNNQLVKTQDFTGKVDVNDFYTETGAFDPGTNVTFRIEMYSGSGFTTDKDNEEPDDVKVQGAGPCKTINISQGECADNGFKFHFLIPNGVGNGSGGQLYITFKYDNGAPQNFGPVNEQANQSSPADWRPIIPFDGHSTITILGAYSTSGGVWVGNGADKATVDASDCVTTTPKLKVIKEVVDHNGNLSYEDTENFSFTVTGQTGFELDDDSSSATPKEKSFDLPAVSGDDDEYTIDETDAGNGSWTLDSITCTGTYVSLSDTDTGDGNIKVKVNNSSDVTCTFVNEKDPPPTRTLWVCKDVVDNGVNPNDEGGNFTLSLTGDLTSSAQFERYEDEDDYFFVPIWPCEHFQVADGATVTITENAAGLPAGWAHAAGYPRIDAYPFATDPANGSSAVTVTVTNDSCDGGATTANTFGVYDCRVDFFNAKGSQPVVVNPSIKKVAHTPNIDGGFAFFDIVVDQPSSNAQAINGLQITDAKTDIVIHDDGAATCSVNSGVLTCDVPATDVTIVVKRPVNAQTLESGTMCQGLIANWLVSAAMPTGAALTITEGNADSKVTYPVVDLTACGGEITMSKAHQMISGSEMWWRITINNTYPVAKTVMVEDIGTPTDSTPTLVLQNETCDGSPSQNGDVFTCVVPANSTAYFHVWTTLPTYTSVDACVPHEVVNTAYLLDPTNTSGNHDGDDVAKTGSFTIQATAGADCITVTKTNTGNGTWNITFSNTGPQATVDMSDTYEPNGTNTNINSVGAPATGCSAFQALSVTGCDVVVPTGTNSVTIAVETDPLGNQCEDQRVVNTVTASYNDEKVNGSGSNDDFSLEGVDELCTREITITKNYVNTGSYSPTAADLPTFTLDPAVANVPGSECTTQDNGSQVILTCTVPADWDGTITETPAAGWTEVRCVEQEQFELVRQVANLLGAAIQQQVLQSEFEFCNEPSGTIRIEKVDGVNGDGSAVLWAFTVGGNFAAPGGAAYANPAQASDATPFVSLPIGLSNTPVTVTEVLARTLDQCTQENAYHTIATPPADTVINTPGEVQTWTFQNIPCGLAGTGGVIIEKYEDINGNGIVDAGDDPIPGWSFVTTGGGIADTNEQTDANGEILDYLQGFDAGTVLTVTETQQTGWTLTRVYLDGANIGTNLSNGVVVIGGETRIIRFLNQQRGSINIHKAAETRHNGVTTPAPNDDDGWTFTLKSAACGIDFVGQTNASGSLSFTGLPMCDDYVVTEVGPNASSPGFVQVSPAGAYTGQTPDGQTLNFVNRKTTSDPPCQDCRQSTPTPSVTPTSTPTATPATPTSTPTNTPTNPPTGASPSITIIAGEKTPGPGQPTPIAPSTGGGIMGGASGSMNILLVVAGLLALTGGLGFLAVGRRKHTS